MNKEDISLIFAGPIEKDGREWELTAFKHNDFLKQVMKFDFSVKQLNDDNAFYIEPFEVDTNGEIRYTVSLVSTKIFDEEGFPEQAPLMIKSPLKKNELENPLIKEFMLPYRFEEISFFYRINSVSQMSQISRKRLQNLAFLSKDSMQKETLIQASENLGEDLDSEENNS